MKNFAHRKLTSRQRVGIVLGAGLVCVVVAIAGACATRAEEEPALLEPSVNQADVAAVVENLRELRQADAVQRRADIAAHEAEVVRSYQSGGFVYSLTRGTGSNRYSYRATEEDVLEELARLELEMAYLREQMDETASAFDETDGAVREFYAAGPPDDNSAEVRALLRDREDLRARAELLQSMRTERMREYETVKLQYETQKRMREGR